jgi:hypothetical protein
MQDLNMHINDLADFIFIKNVNDSIIQLSLNGVEDMKDLFYFCLDLFCKGLVILFGQDNKVEVENITLEQFMLLRKKMANAGININLNIYEDIEGEENEEKKVALNLEKIEELPNNLNIEDYDFILRSCNMVYKINFGFISGH